MFATDDSLAKAIARPSGNDAADARARTMANSARQTVLRRVAPALKHDMVVHLQALAMMAEMLNARVDRGTVSPADLQANISKLNRLAREAVMGCLKVTSWIESADEESIAVDQGVEECVRLLSASFNFRGFAIVNEVGPSEFEVCRNPLRTLLVASLITLADTAPAACEFLIESEVEGSDVVLSVASRPRQQQAAAAIPPATDAIPRPLVDWSEVQALAALERVQLSRSDGGITLRVPRAVVTSPLQMAPV